MDGPGPAPSGYAPSSVGPGGPGRRGPMAPPPAGPPPGMAPRPRPSRSGTLSSSSPYGHPGHTSDSQPGGEGSSRFGGLSKWLPSVGSVMNSIGLSPWGSSAGGAEERRGGGGGEGPPPPGWDGGWEGGRVGGPPPSRLRPTSSRILDPGLATSRYPEPSMPGSVDREGNVGSAPGTGSRPGTGSGGRRSRVLGTSANASSPTWQFSRSNNPLPKPVTILPSPTRRNAPAGGATSPSQPSGGGVSEFGARRPVSFAVTVEDEDEEPFGPGDAGAGGDRDSVAAVRRKRNRRQRTAERERQLEEGGFYARDFAPPESSPSALPSRPDTPPRSRISGAPTGSIANRRDGPMPPSILLNPQTPEPPAVGGEAASMLSVDAGARPSGVAEANQPVEDQAMRAYSPSPPPMNDVEMANAPTVSATGPRMPSVGSPASPTSRTLQSVGGAGSRAEAQYDLPGLPPPSHPHAQGPPIVGPPQLPPGPPHLPPPPAAAAPGDEYFSPPPDSVDPPTVAPFSPEDHLTSQPRSFQPPPAPPPPWPAGFPGDGRERSPPLPSTPAHNAFAGATRRRAFPDGGRRRVRLQSGEEWNDSGSYFGHNGGLYGPGGMGLDDSGGNYTLPRRVRMPDEGYYRRMTVDLAPGGHLILDLPIPPLLRTTVVHPQTFSAHPSNYSHFDTVRYSAMTCDPDFMREEGWTLRQTPDWVREQGLLGKPLGFESASSMGRRGASGFGRGPSGLSDGRGWGLGSGEGRPLTSAYAEWGNGHPAHVQEGQAGSMFRNPGIEICICVTLYNERADSFTATLDGIYRNISYLCNARRRGRSNLRRTIDFLCPPLNKNRLNDSKEKWPEGEPLHGAAEGIEDEWTYEEMRARDPSAEAGWFREDSWKKVVVVIVADGMDKVDQRVLDNMEAMGIFQPECCREAGPDGRWMPRTHVGGQDIKAHVYEFTTQIPPPDYHARGSSSTPDPIPVQTILCLKTKNLKKINSHRWFFNGFCSILQPRTTVLLDIGTKPDPDAIYHLWRPMYKHPQIGGACGEIKPAKGKGYRLLLNPLVAAQNFEYKMSNILDKPLESAFGFIQVLPGAFSAYRYSAIQNDPVTGRGPLRSYFLGEFGQRQQPLSALDQYGNYGVQLPEKRTFNPVANVFERNMYLAEDRILCWEIVSKTGHNYTLYYSKLSVAATDPVEHMPELILQRRRWLNGSFFVAVHAVVHFAHIFRSSHSLLRKLFFCAQWLYNVVSLFFNWFLPGNFFISFVFISEAMETQVDNVRNYQSANGGAFPGIHVPTIFAYWLYLASFASIVILSLGNKPNGIASQWFYKWASFGYAVLIAYMFGSTIYLVEVAVRQVIDMPGKVTFHDLVRNCNMVKVFFALFSTYGVYLLSSIIALQPWHLMTSFVQYLLLSPTYVNIFNTFAFCNTNDFSWGTKGSSTATDKAGDTELVGGNTNLARTNVPSRLQLTNSFERARIRLQDETFLSDRKEKKVERAHETPQQKEEREKEEMLDYYSSFRTFLVMSWAGSNIILAAVVVYTAQGRDIFTGGPSSACSPNDRCCSPGSGYMTFLLYSIFGLSTIRFFGFLWYTVGLLFTA